MTGNLTSSRNLFRFLTADYMPNQYTIRVSVIPPFDKVASDLL